MDEEDQPSAGSGGGGVAQRAAKHAAKKAVKHGGRKVLIALGVKGGFWVGLVVLLLLVIAAAAGAASRPGRLLPLRCGPQVALLGVLPGTAVGMRGTSSRTRCSTTRPR